MLLLHGYDGTVKLVNPRKMAERMREAGNPVELIEYKSVGPLCHRGEAAPFQAQGGIADAATAFIRGEAAPVPADAATRRH